MTPKSLLRQIGFLVLCIGSGLSIAPQAWGAADCCIPINLVAMPAGYIEYSEFRCCCNALDPDDCTVISGNVRVYHSGGYFYGYTCGYGNDCEGPRIPPVAECGEPGSSAWFNQDPPPYVKGTEICDGGCYNLGCIAKPPENYYPVPCECDEEETDCH